jgi:hypothetical protein
MISLEGLRVVYTDKKSLFKPVLILKDIMLIRLDFLLFDILKIPKTDTTMNIRTKI